MKLIITLLLGITMLGVAATGSSAADSQGISKTEIVIGTIQDLSGPVTAYGKQTRSGMQMRADEINERGGINGRKLKLLVEEIGRASCRERVYSSV